MTGISLDSKIPGVKKTDSTSIAQNVEYSPSKNSPVEQILFLQRTIGNHAVGRIIRSASMQVVQKNDDMKPPPVEMPIRGEGSAMLSPEVTSASVYELPDETSTVLSQFDKKTPLKLVATSGSFYVVEIEGKKRYVKQVDFISVIETEDWEGKADAAINAMVNAGHTKRYVKTPVGSDMTFPPQWFMDLQKILSMTNVWEEQEETAQNVLCDYANWYLSYNLEGNKPTRNVQILFEYIGRSSLNDAAAIKNKYKGTSHFGGGLRKDGRPAPNWCTPATTTAYKEALKEMGYAPSGKVEDSGKKYGGDQAYQRRLNPGDQVMFLFDRPPCQYGGHTVTVIEDTDDSFTHVSGNTGSTPSVSISKSKRLRHPPISKGSKEIFDLKKCLGGNDMQNKAANDYIEKFNFEGSALVWSIVGYGEVISKLDALRSLDPAVKVAEENKLLAEFHLTRV